MKNCFISTYKGEWMVPATVLKERLGYEIVELNGKEYPSIANKGVLCRKEIRNIYNVVKNLKKINHSETVICSNYVCLFLLLMQKLKILKVKKICWYGMYIHNPKWIKILGGILRALSPSPDNFRIIVFSNSERKLYAEKWRGGVDSACFLYVPYGDWSNSLSQAHIYQGDYFFSGGYSNRDYIPLVEAFAGRKEKLVIVASKQNTDLVEWICSHELSENISVYYDISNEHFNELLCGAKAVVLIMKHNTGASGQMVALKAMANYKLIIATYTDVLDEYVKNNESALIFNKEDIHGCLQDIILKVCEDINDYQPMIDAAYKAYKTKFSFEALSEALVEQVIGL